MICNEGMEELSLRNDGQRAPLPVDANHNIKTEYDQIMQQDQDENFSSHVKIKKKSQELVELRGSTRINHRESSEKRLEEENHNTSSLKNLRDGAGLSIVMQELHPQVPNLSA
mmetsp:Transcript_33663/g.51978  ORF Transcript_33663/g.51978 Transcript_33663/m.51978 type:complete len:113 (-) Transcript_33663:1946-2284(-)|eukprot:CAMPEP_0170495710 /NCGR_PEP_ID=MMETSP0208-20121228/18315_1 /TAXON_ID=197538 /ORGANISM="Strombidium inclinatum, Strain S3" /LENGTH=112 /DNA_ID=CAMNT_0010772049 /DNA_START=1432 /DNA_END=1773 /DNA_ORIENTATION=+